MFSEEADLKFYLKIHKKMPALETLFNKVKGLHPATLFEKRLRHMCLKWFRISFFQSNSGKLFWNFRFRYGKVQNRKHSVFKHFLRSDTEREFPFSNFS